MSPPPTSSTGWPVDTTKDTKSQLAQRIFNSLVQDALCNLAISTHQVEARRRYRSEADHASHPTGSDERPSQLESQLGGEQESATTLTPEDGQVPPTLNLPKASSGGSTTGVPTGLASNGNSGSGSSSTSAPLPTTTTVYTNPLIRCMVCNRHVSSNRFAPHLAKCMGLGSSSSGGGAGGSGAAGSSSKTAGNAGLKRKAALGAATAAALAAQAGSGSGSITVSKRGRPPKSRGGTGSGRSTATPVPGLGGKEGSAAL